VTLVETYFLLNNIDVEPTQMKAKECFCGAKLPIVIGKVNKE
jgi:hypothetical protein